MDKPSEEQQTLVKIFGGTAFVVVMIIVLILLGIAAIVNVATSLQSTLFASILLLVLAVAQITLAVVIANAWYKSARKGAKLNKAQKIGVITTIIVFTVLGVATLAFGILGFVNPDQKATNIWAAIYGSIMILIGVVGAVVLAAFGVGSAKISKYSSLLEESSDARYLNALKYVLETCHGKQGGVDDCDPTQREQLFRSYEPTKFQEACRKLEEYCPKDQEQPCLTRCTAEDQALYAKIQGQKVGETVQRQKEEKDAQKEALAKEELMQRRVPLQGGGGYMELTAEQMKTKKNFDDAERKGKTVDCMKYAALPPYRNERGKENENRLALAQSSAAFKKCCENSNNKCDESAFKAKTDAFVSELYAAEGERERQRKPPPPCYQSPPDFSKLGRLPTQTEVNETLDAYQDRFKRCVVNTELDERERDAILDVMNRQLATERNPTVAKMIETWRRGE